MGERDSVRGGRWRSLIRPRVLLCVFMVGVVAVAVGAVGSVLWVRHLAADGEYSAQSVPQSDVALVFGAQVYANGEPSPYLAARLDIGKQLLEAGKVRALLLSGDNGRSNYDEPTAMRDYLVEKGVPATKIALDYAGFSTYETCVRAHQIFGVRSAIVATQDFSMPRTLAVCRHAGIDTAGVADTGQPHNLTYRKIWLRDQVAASKAAIDMITDATPTFLGDQETTVRDAMNAPMP